MALHTRCNARSRKLRAMNVFMAGFTFRRRGLEIHVSGRSPLIRRLMASATRSAQMGAQQRERSSRMIKAREFFPRFGGMANFAAAKGAIGCGPHEVGKLPAMRVGMTFRASQSVRSQSAPAITRRRRIEFRGGLMAIAARDRLMAFG